MTIHFNDSFAVCRVNSKNISTGIETGFLVGNLTEIEQKLFSYQYLDHQYQQQDETGNIIEPRQESICYTFCYWIR